MQIKKDTVAEFHYTLSEGDKLIETSKESEPMVLLIGHKNMLEGVEEVLIDKTAGESVSVTLPPEKAYGQPKEDSIQRIPMKHLQGAKKWKPGMTATVESNQGRKQVTVVKVGRFNVDCDVNHPLAGKTLTFELEVLSVRDAEAVEISHGHVHGKGGVHH
jgi:FKBP-type peptidyl-prolyl cis-trans isomerase SlyD